MKTIFYVLAAAAFSAAITLPAGATTIASSSFDTGASGWSSESFLADGNDDHPIFSSPLASYGVNWSVLGGNPGGTINLTDQDSGWQYFVAPGAYLGNQSAALGGNISFDLQRTDGNGSFPAQAAPPLAITNGITTLVFAAAGAPTTTNWTSYSLTLTPGGGILVGSIFGPQATQTQLNSVLANITGMYILSDWYVGIGDAYNLDNVAFTAPDATSSTPEPSSFALLLAGGVGLLAARCKKRRATISR